MRVEIPDDMRKMYERIHDDLCIRGDVTGEGEDHRLMIVKTLAQIPHDVREKVLDETCFIIACKGVIGHAWIMNFTLPKILRFILLNFVEMEGKSEPEILSVIAHETAHHVLARDSCDSGGLNAEVAADDLIEKWGFQRTYEDYSAFRKYERSINTQEDA
jgi:hypothetical protein